VSLLGPMNVTRAVLPVMRKQRFGHVVTITSTAGIVGGETASAYAGLSIDDYAERSAAIRPWWEGLNGQQQGDPAKLAAALVQIIDQEEPPVRWAAGADAVAAVQQKAHGLLAQVEAYRDLSPSLAHDAAAGEHASV
jgi:hypothetical protein